MAARWLPVPPCVGETQWRTVSQGAPAAITGGRLLGDAAGPNVFKKIRLLREPVPADEIKTVAVAFLKFQQLEYAGGASVLSVS